VLVAWRKLIKRNTQQTHAKGCEMSNDQTLKQALNRRSQRVIGTVESGGQTYNLGLRDSPGYGVVVPFLKVAGKAPYNFGRFSYEQTVDGLVTFLKSQRLADDAVIKLSA
jgi:hypothetical protein